MNDNTDIKIEVKNIVKRYGDITALNGVNLAINKGLVFGLLGPNGAGKTTLISSILGLTEYDDGEVLVEGHLLNTSSLEFKKQLGIVPQEIALYDDLTGFANLRFFGSLYGISGSELDDRANELLKLIGLHDRGNKRVSTYSGGMKRRLNLAVGIIHNPKTVLMDEPTVGIDPQSRNLIYELVDSLKKQGITILYTTHYMDEAERLCDRIAIIDLGKIIALGSLDELIELIGELDLIKFDLKKPGKKSELVNLFPQCDVEIEENKLTLKTRHGRERIPEIMRTLNDRGIEILSATLLTPNLETVFLHLTGKELRD